jgi:hypothetical protein
MRKLIPYVLVGLALIVAPAHAQWATTGTTTLSVTVGPEAAIHIDTANTPLATIGTNFNNPYTGTTNYSYKVRTTQATGAAHITLYVSTDFNPANGPSVGTPPTAGDALTYTCTAASPANACSGTQTATTVPASATPVADFGANAHSLRDGTPGNSVIWSLTNDPKYEVGAYTAVVTFTISVT